MQKNQAKPDSKRSQFSSQNALVGARETSDRETEFDGATARAVLAAGMLRALINRIQVVSMIPI
jgi:hypothetical protein